MKISNITINGTKQTDLVKNDYSTENLQLDHSFRIGQTIRGETHQNKIKLEDDQIIEFVFEDDTVWISSSNTLDDIFPENIYSSDRSAGDSFEIPTEISFEDEAERGLLK